MELEEAIKICKLLCGKKNKNGKREYKTFTRLQMQVYYSVDEMAQAIETLIKYIKEESIPRAVLQKKIREYKQILTNLNRFSDVDRIKALNERILVLEEILNKGEN